MVFDSQCTNRKDQPHAGHVTDVEAFNAYIRQNEVQNAAHRARNRVKLLSEYEWNLVYADVAEYASKDGRDYPKHYGTPP